MATKKSAAKTEEIAEVKETVAAEVQAEADAAAEKKPAPRKRAAKKTAAEKEAVEKPAEVEEEKISEADGNDENPMLDEIRNEIPEEILTAPMKEEEIPSGETIAESEEQVRRRKRSVISSFERQHETVISMTGTNHASREVEEFRNAVIELSMSKKNNTVLYGTLTSVERFKGGRLVGVLQNGPIKIYIAAEKLLPPRITDEAEGDRFAELTPTRIRYLLTGRLGCTVSYVVEELFAEEGYAVANHLFANEINKRRYFLNKNAAGHSRIEPGALIEVPIIGVRRWGVVLDVFGFEKNVFMSDLNDMRVDSASMVYAVGETIEVRVIDVVIEDGELKDVKVSGRVLKDDATRAAINKLTVGATHIGTVSRVDENAVFVTVNIDGVDLTCYCSYARIGVRNGSSVKVEISGKNAEQKRVWGRITRVNRV